MCSMAIYRFNDVNVYNKYWLIIYNHTQSIDIYRFNDVNVYNKYLLIIYNHTQSIDIVSNIEMSIWIINR